MNLPDGLKEAHKLAASLSPKEHEKEGTELATHLKGRVPIIYASTRNRAVAYNWKIKCNETGKIPAFMNVVPELNHNEMNGFDVRPATKKLSNHFHWILLHDTEDDERVQKRMAMLERMLFDRGFRTTGVDFDGATRFDRIFRSLLVADWFAVATATQYGLDATDVPMVEEFKHLITE